MHTPAGLGYYAVGVLTSVTGLEGKGRNKHKANKTFLWRRSPPEKQNIHFDQTHGSCGVGPSSSLSYQSPLSSAGRLGRRGSIEPKQILIFPVARLVPVQTFGPACISLIYSISAISRQPTYTHTSYSNHPSARPGQRPPRAIGGVPTIKITLMGKKRGGQRPRPRSTAHKSVGGGGGR